MGIMRYVVARYYFSEKYLRIAAFAVDGHICTIDIKMFHTFLFCKLQFCYLNKFYQNEIWLKLLLVALICLWMKCISCLYQEHHYDAVIGPFGDAAKNTLDHSKDGLQTENGTTHTLDCSFGNISINESHDPALDKAATKIQANYKGYKTRKAMNKTKK